MTYRPITDPLAEERLLAVVPEPGPAAESGSHRLNLFSGRALSDGALRSEQEHGDGRLRQLARLRSAGVVEGLEVSLEQPATEEQWLRLSPGLGLCASGEDVWLPQPLRLRFSDLPQLNSAKAANQRLWILVLQPVSLLQDEAVDPNRCNEWDESGRAFEAETLRDGVRLVVVPLEWEATFESPGRWRNELAQALLDVERTRRENGEPPEWEAEGVPVALIALTADLKRLAFVDRAAVVRPGGRPLPTTPLLPGRLPAALNQARLRQFADQMAELPPSGASTPDQVTAWMEGQVLPCFRYLPPFGLLPEEALLDRTLQPVPEGQLRDVFRTNLTTQACCFFPSNWHVHLAAIPQEQLERALRDANDLAPYDLDQPDQVQLWVPVPQALYEPDLLLQENVDGIFQQKIDEAKKLRDDWLQRRGWLRRRLAAITRAVTGKPVLFPIVDPNQLDSSEPSIDPTADSPDSSTKSAESDPEGQDYGTQLLSQPTKRVATVMQKLIAELTQDSPIDNDVVAIKPKAALKDEQKIAFLGSLADLNAKFGSTLRYDFGTQLLTVSGVLKAESGTDLNKNLNELFNSNLFEGAAGAINDLVSRSKDNTELQLLESNGVASFIDRLQAKTAQSDDRVEFGFLQVRTNMYRIRQQVMGQEDAIKLATSSTLAAIASRDAARISQQDLSAYFKQIKASRLTTTAPADAMAVKAPADSTKQDQAANLALEQSQALPGAISMQSLARNPMVAVRAGVAAPFTTPANSSLVTPINASLFQSAAPAKVLLRKDTLIGDVIGQSPLIGRVPESVTVAQRLEQPAPINTRDFAIDDRNNILQSMASQDVFKDLLIPGQDGLTFGKVKGSASIPPVKDIPDKNDEVTYFSSAVQTLDETVAALRLGEGRVQQYRIAISRCQEALVELRRQQGRLEERLREVDNALAEARQDVSVATALLAEETARVGAINERRSRVLREQVPFLAFQRPRSLDLRRSSPTLPLDPGPSPDPLPPCLNDTTAIPQEVRAMVELLREAPLSWFNSLRPALRRLDRVDTLVRLFSGASQRRTLLAASAPPALATISDDDTPIARSIGRLYGQRQQLLRQESLGLPPQVDQLVARQSWQESLQQAERQLSLGDLLAADHRRPELSGKAAQLLEQWCRVATCLKDHFGAIETRLRLDWAERLSQFDGPVNLRVLTNLPRWDEVDDLRQRRALQSLVDWLFLQLNGDEPQALAFANDLVRLSLLLACHAPVNQILSGQVIGTPALASENRVPIRMDPLRVRIGMPVLFHGAAGVMAEGIVEDLSGSVATTRILRGDASLSAGPQIRVQFLRQTLR